MAGDRSSWNHRDSHMVDTLAHVSRFYGPHSRGVIWAHNTHNGDARATTMAQRCDSSLLLVNRATERVRYCVYLKLNVRP